MLCRVERLHSSRVCLSNCQPRSCGRRGEVSRCFTARLGKSTPDACCPCPSPPSTSSSPPSKPSPDFNIKSKTIYLSASTLSLPFWSNPATPRLPPLITKIIHSSPTSGTVPSLIQNRLSPPFTKNLAWNPTILQQPPSHLKPSLQPPKYFENLSLLNTTTTSPPTTSTNDNSVWFPVTLHQHRKQLIKKSLTISSKPTDLRFTLHPHLLDLTAAFDTFSSTLQNRLTSSHHPTPTPWFTSYLSGSLTESFISKPTKTALFLSLLVSPRALSRAPPHHHLYSSHSVTILRSHNIHFHCYADDTQTLDLRRERKPSLWMEN
uniref:Reverse transcriptase domain-containing protein n=1 Tax=Knipowitschia caucasica TaxID=637954 RepID=A0AAV2KKD5_KNICA